MKKIIALTLCFLMLFGLSACTKSNVEETGERLPKAFGILKNGTTLEKHGKRGESTTFTESDFETAVGADITYITITDLPDASEGVLVFRGSSVLAGQSLPAEQLSYLRFVPTDASGGSGFGFTCDANGWQNAELRCSITLSDSDNLAPIASDGELYTVEGIACEGRISALDPNGDEVTVNILNYPKEGFLEVMADGRVFYTPNSGYTGNDSLTYTVTDRYGAVSDRATMKITVSENKSGIFFADMDGDPAHLSAQQMCENEIMTYKYADGEYTFDPDGEVKRIDFLVMLMCTTGLSDSVNAVADSIVTDDNGLSSGLKGFLAAAADKGIIKLENGNFRPKSSVTFAEAATMVASAISIPAFDTTGAVFGSNGDMGASLASLVRDGIIDSAEDPGRVLTRRECATVLYRVSKYLTDNNITN